MATVQKVQARGQIELRREVGVQAEDTVLPRATKPHTIELTVLPRLTLADALQRYRIDGAIDVAALRAEAEEAMFADALRGMNG